MEIKKKRIYAHKRIINNNIFYEELEAHAALTREYAKEISSKDIVEKLGYDYEEFLNGVEAHDLGKQNLNFQNKIKNISNYGDTRHSIFSAILYIEKNLKILNKQIFLNAYVIYKHHSMLTDIKDFNLELESIVQFKQLLQNEISFKKTLFEKCLHNLKKNFESTDYLYVRYFFSVLGSADIFATQEFMSGYKFEKCREFSELKECFMKDEILENIKNGRLGTGINELRSTMALEAMRNFEGGVSLLEAPTGCGKTKTGYLLAELSNKKRLFYVAPFNNISNQTYKELLSLFSIEDVGLINSLSEISLNFNDESEMIEAYNNYYYLNSPIVVTSGVNFFNILYSNKKKDILSFYTLANSCIIIDEIHAFNLNLWKTFSLDISILSKIFNIDFIIMSATLPNLKIFSSKFNNLIENRDYYFKSSYFKDRVEPTLIDIQNLDDLKTKTIELSKEYSKVLIEFINKKSAYEFYEMLTKDFDFSSKEVLLITGDTKNQERQDILAKTESKINVWEGVLIGTQVIEAGVNIDFDIGLKDISILESEEQFSGRINRNALKKNSKVYFFNYFDAKKILKNDVRTSKELTLMDVNIFESFKNKEFLPFYEKVMGFLDLKSEFKDYWNFEEKSKFMKLIDNDGETVFILSRETKEVFEKYNEIYENLEISFYERAIRLKNLKSKIIDNSITLYHGDDRLEKIERKNGVNYLKSVDL
ncbi:MAG: CRISPR-associated helicase Cas3' [Cetobacterium sp.]|uniref:CRISPR-associated helicase Cas3' n=1 Tax=Cetobacterium sp. TaxID=2071632 RepID=UPI003F335E54